MTGTRTDIKVITAPGKEKSDVTTIYTPVHGIRIYCFKNLSYVIFKTEDKKPHTAPVTNVPYESGAFYRILLSGFLVTSVDFVRNKSPAELNMLKDVDWVQSSRWVYVMTKIRSLDQAEMGYSENSRAYWQFSEREQIY